jgi:hypothetical protein
MALLKELYEKIGRGGSNGIFPGAELVEIADGTGMIPAIKVKTEFLTRAECERLRQNFDVRVEGSKQDYAHIIEKQEKPKKQKKPNFLAKIIRTI